MIGRYDGSAPTSVMSVPCSVVTYGSLRRVARVVAAQHLARQHRADRMRNGVMHVQQVELVDLGDLGHARRQRQVVRRILEQRITRDLDLVIVNVGLRFGQADGLRIGDEVDLVAALRQLQSELGGDHTAAAVSGITGYADSHM